MNKYGLTDMITDKLKRELGIVVKPLPEKIKSLEAVLPSGKLRLEPVLYQAEKLKKITISKHSRGESGAGTLLMIIGEDEYDLPFILIDIAFDFVEKGKMLVEFEVRPLIKDDESTTKNVAPFNKWYEAINKLPGEPVTQFPVGEYMKANLPAFEYLRFVPELYTSETISLVEQFLDIFLGIYRKAEPVQDAERRRKMDSYRAEWNRHILGDDPSGQSLVQAFGQQTAELYFECLAYM